MRVRNRLLPGALALLAVVLAIFFIREHWGDDVESPAADGKQAAGFATALRWRAGTEQRYTVLVDSSFELTMPGAGPGQSMNLRIDAVLDYKTLEVGAPGANVGMRFTSMDMAINGARDAGVNRSLTTPFRVRFDSNGLPLAFEFPAELGADHREILENLVRMFQVVIQDGDSWLVEEVNASGRYEASYESTSPSTLVKRKRRYLAPGAGTSDPEVESTESIRIDTGHDWVAEMTLDETLVVRDPGSTPVRVSNHASIELQSAQRGVVGDSWRFPAAAPPASEEELPTAAKPLAPGEARRRLADDIAALDTAERGRSILIHRVRDLLLADSGLCEVLLESMRGGEFTDRTRADLYLAFELAGTPVAQAALTSVVTDPGWSPQDAMRAIVALGGVAEPTAATLSSLWDLAHTDLADTERRDLPGTAALAIGSLGSTLRTSESAEYLSLRADLLLSASSATEPVDRAVFLYALGNTADPDPTLSRDIVSYLDDPSPRVRGAAAKTLGRLGTDQVAKELMQRVTSETHGEARAAMIEALASWEDPTPTAIEWARGAIGAEQDEKARYNMAVLLGNNMDRFPDNRAVLESLLESEPSRRIRQQVADLLYEM